MRLAIHIAINAGRRIFSVAAAAVGVYATALYGAAVYEEEE